MVLSCVKPLLEWCYVNQNKKNHTLKCTTWQCNQWKVLQCCLRIGHLPSFLCPCHGELGSSSALAPRNLPCKAKKKNANYPEGGMGAPGIDWFISSLIQWNLEITNLYIIKSLVLQIIFFTPVTVKYMEKSLDITESRYNKFCQFLGPSLYWGPTVA